jgi:hypothetical protein
VIAGFGLFVMILTAACIVACIRLPTARRVIGWTAAAVALILGLVVLIVAWSAWDELGRRKQAMERIAPTEVQFESLELSGTSKGSYRLRGFVRNLSTRYTLTDVTFDVIVEDCISGRCREQGRGHAEAIRRVPPGAAVAFDTDDVLMPSIGPTAGRRLSYHVWNTWAEPVMSHE